MGDRVPRSAAEISQLAADLERCLISLEQQKDDPEMISVTGGMIRTTNIILGLLDWLQGNDDPTFAPFLILTHQIARLSQLAPPSTEPSQ